MTLSLRAPVPACLTPGPEASRRLAPYAALAPGLSIGFEAERGADIRLGDGEEGARLEIRDPGRSRWLTLEAELDPEALAGTRAILLATTLAAAPRARLAVSLRLWRDAGTFEDLPLGSIAVRPEPTRLFLARDVSATLDGPRPPRAQLMMLFPLVEAVVEIREVLVLPGISAGEGSAGEEERDRRWVALQLAAAELSRLREPALPPWEVAARLHAIAASPPALPLPPPPDFDEAAYLASNPDVARMKAAGQVGSGFDHYMRAGRAEGRSRPA